MAKVEQKRKQKIIFVTGKGGVGKSLIAAAIAFEKAKNGRKVLLVELGDTSYFQDLFDFGGQHALKVTHRPVSTKFGFDVALWGGESSLREYVLHYLRMEKLYNLFFDNKVMRALVNVAPGLPEIAMLGKITSGIRNVGPELMYDDIIVDSFATGHTVTLLNTPKAMKEAIPLGPMGHHSGEIEEVLRDKTTTSVVIVTLLEELPVVESLELSEVLKKSLSIDAKLIANRVLQSPVSESEIQIEANASSSLSEFAKYISSLRARQSDLLKRLTNSGHEVSVVPQIFSSETEQLLNSIGGSLRKTSIVS